MEEHRSEGQERIGVRITSTSVSVAPGESVAIPIALVNLGLEEGAFLLAVQGIPGDWLYLPSPLVRLAPGEQEEVTLTIRPPDSPEGRAGHHTFKVLVFAQEAPEPLAEVECILTVAALEVRGPIGILMASTEYAVAPGDSQSIPIVLINGGPVDEVFEVSVQGDPTAWVSVPSPAVRLPPGARREVSLTIQPPGFPQTRAGRYPFVIRVASRETPGAAAQADCQLTVAAAEVPGRIGVLLATTEFSVVPGDSVTIPVVLLNQGLEEDSFRLSVDGIPATWVSTTSPVTHLTPGQQREVPLTITPPRSTQSRAGRHSLKLQVFSQATPEQMAEAECILTIGVFTKFRGDLRPPRAEAGQPARVTVENQGNVQQAFTLTWHSLDDELRFEPDATQELRVRAGEAAMLEFRASPRRRPLFGGERTHAFTAQVQSAEKEVQNLGGEVVSRGLIPTWVLTVAIVLIVATACLVAFLVFGGGALEVRPTETAIAEVTATEEAPVPTEALPTEVPPTEAPTELPTEEPTAPPPTEEPTVEPTEEPTAPPPTEEPTVEPTEEPPVEPTEGPTVEPTDEGGGGPGPEIPCLPAAGAIVLVPLLRKRGRLQRS